MLTKKDLKEQDVFTIYTDGNYYDGEGDYVICFEAKGAVLRAHCEVNGILDIIKPLMSLEDLDNTVDMLNIVRPY